MYSKHVFLSHYDERVFRYQVVGGLIQGIGVTGGNEAGVEDRVVEAEVEVGLLGVVVGRRQKYSQFGGQLLLVLLLASLLLLRLEWREVRANVHARCSLLCSPLHRLHLEHVLQEGVGGRQLHLLLHVDHLLRSRQSWTELHKKGVLSWDENVFCLFLQLFFLFFSGLNRSWLLFPTCCQARPQLVQLRHNNGTEVDGEKEAAHVDRLVGLQLVELDGGVDEEGEGARDGDGQPGQEQVRLLPGTAIQQQEVHQQHNHAAEDDHNDSDELGEGDSGEIEEEAEGDGNTVGEADGSDARGERATAPDLSKEWCQPASQTSHLPFHPLTLFHFLPLLPQGAVAFLLPHHLIPGN